MMFCLVTVLCHYSMNVMEILQRLGGFTFQRLEFSITPSSPLALPFRHLLLHSRSIFPSSPPLPIPTNFLLLSFLLSPNLRSNSSTSSCSSSVVFPLSSFTSIPTTFLLRHSVDVFAMSGTI